MVVVRGKCRAKALIVGESIALAESVELVDAEVLIAGDSIALAVSVELVAESVVVKRIFAGCWPLMPVNEEFMALTAAAVILCARAIKVCVSGKADLYDLIENNRLDVKYSTYAYGNATIDFSLNNFGVTDTFVSNSSNSSATTLRDRTKKLNISLILVLVGVLCFCPLAIDMSAMTFTNYFDNSSEGLFCSSNVGNGLFVSEQVSLVFDTFEASIARVDDLSLTGEVLVSSSCLAFCSPLDLSLNIRGAFVEASSKTSQLLSLDDDFRTA
uniref:Uncharacterized protein n=1 Tax=Glossina austeni TaxID=7395 RepID=A0A1A9V1M6_GLOAU